MSSSPIICCAQATAPGVGLKGHGPRRALRQGKTQRSLCPSCGYSSH
ncbi:hypothetical protein AIOL_002876 [Candidatus Rhodobacter oscarellae]|uniref:Uncharacterized protein n=1 Tax=Candidatus Rhodobacter oscarellae TaxID=1675527 RepID=A0A0J9GWI7_9RHOB|nr:hypothetical protein AIOL_002876 [Candidatus Rhodobacter lobularis]